MAIAFRVIDTDVIGSRANVAFDRAMIDLRAAGTIGDTIRFLRFPASVLIGRHQALQQEVDVAYCRTHGIEIARRITGGGAIYFDPGQLGWSLVFERATLGLRSLESVTRAICEAAAAGLSTLGIEARYRPRNDIEVDGRKLSGTGGFFDGDTLFYQGTVLVDMDFADMAAALRVPASKLGKRGLASVADRVVTLRELLGDATPGVQPIQDALLTGFRERLGIVTTREAVRDDERAAAAAIERELIGTDAFVWEIDAPAEAAGVLTGVRETAGGTIRSHVRLEGPRQDRIREVVFTGDFFVTPPRLIRDFEAALRGVRTVEAGAAVTAFFERADFGALSVGPDDFAGVLDAALGAAEAP